MLEGYNERDVSLHKLPFLACLLTKIQSHMILYFLALLSMFQAQKMECQSVALSHSFETEKDIFIQKNVLNVCYVLGIILDPPNKVIDKILQFSDKYLFCALIDLHWDRGIQ